MTHAILDVLKTTKKKPKSVLAKNIIDGRNRLGLSAEKFAELAKIPYPTLRDVEAGMSGGRPATLKKIATALNCEPWELSKPFNPKPEHLQNGNQGGPNNGHHDEGNQRSYEHPDDKGVNPVHENQVGNCGENEKTSDDKGSLGHVTTSAAQAPNLNPATRAQSILDIQAQLNGLSDGELKNVAKFIADIKTRNGRNTGSGGVSDVV